MIISRCVQLLISKKPLASDAHIHLFSAYYTGLNGK